MVGSCEMFKPKGEIPPDIPDMFDSREVIKDGVGVVHVVKKPSQILPYCIIKLKKDSITSTGLHNITQPSINSSHGQFINNSQPLASPTPMINVTTGNQPITGQMTWNRHD